MEIKRDESWLQLNGKYKCPYCDKEYSKMGICSHIWRSHGSGKEFNPFENSKRGYENPWNKGLTKNDHPGIARGAKKFKDGLASGRIKPSFKDRPLSKVHKEKISKSMKDAHRDGRAWNIGMSRWNNEPSYPEKFFMRVIENEFVDKNYFYEFSIGIYSFDFAWSHKKLAIEIDGSQHQRFKEYQDRDSRKEVYANENGWKILRIIWKDMFNNPKEHIQIAKTFIDGEESR